MPIKDPELLQLLSEAQKGRVRAIIWYSQDLYLFFQLLGRARRVSGSDGACAHGTAELYGTYMGHAYARNIHKHFLHASASEMHQTIMMVCCSSVHMDVHNGFFYYH